LFYQYNPAGNSWGHMSWGMLKSGPLSLRKVPAFDVTGDPIYTLVQRQVKELRQLHANKLTLDTDTATWPPVAVAKRVDLSDMNFVLETTLQPR
jgi:hypothetical protein